MKFWFAVAAVNFGVLGCVHPRHREEMCTYAGMENAPASSSTCVPPAPPPPPPPPPPAPVMCPYPGLGALQANDELCEPIVQSSGPIDSASLIEPAFFAKNSSVLRPADAKSVDLKIPWLKANPGLKIRIEGTDDDLKSDAASMQLGQKRALQAKRRLMLGGIDGSRVDVVSYGEERPVCIEKTEACRAKNRRVDFVVVSVGSAYLQVGELTTPTIDSLPWPPPRPSIREVLPLNLCHDPAHPTLQGSWDLIHAAFERAGFPDDERTFSIGKNEGFAILGRMEAINDDGTPKPNNARWGSPLGSDPGGFSVSQWFKEVFSRVTGRYRVIAIVMTRRTMVTTKDIPTMAHLDSIVDSGPIGPPPAEVGALAMPASVPCYALIYELERPSIPKNTAIVPSHIRARDHLAKARMWSKPQLRIP
jgi:outer membrane protein OmpA-like peptidoglycan-associated protein